MKTKKILLLTLLLSGLMVLAACAPETTPAAPDEPQEPPKPELTEPVTPPDPDPMPEPTEPIAYPEPEEHQPARPIDPNAYPAPGEVVSDEPVGIDPYPGVGDEGNEEVLTPIDFLALPADKNLQPGRVYIDGTQVIMKESYPVQVELLVVGNLPTPCHQLRVITSEPDADGHIQIQVYSVSNPETMCTQVLKPFEAVIPLGDYTEGNFTFSVNDELDGKFQLP